MCLDHYFWGRNGDTDHLCPNVTENRLQEPDINSDCLLAYFHQTGFIVYLVVLLLSLVGLYYFIYGYKLVSINWDGLVKADVMREKMECMWAHECYKRGETYDKYDGKTLLQIIADPDELHPFVYVTRFGPQFYPFVHAAFGGMAGANSIMFAKAVLIFGKNMVTGPDQGLSAAYLGVFLVPFGLCLFAQIKYLNVALAIYRDSLFVLPCYQSFWIVFGIAAGPTLHQECPNPNPNAALQF